MSNPFNSRPLAVAFCGSKVFALEKHLLKVGGLGLLGLAMPRLFARRGMGQGLKPPKARAKVDHFPPYQFGGAEPSRNLRHEARRAGRHPWFAAIRN